MNLFSIFKMKSKIVSVSDPEFVANQRKFNYRKMYFDKVSSNRYSCRDCGKILLKEKDVHIHITKTPDVCELNCLCIKCGILLGEDK